jgi:RNA polymerase sigma-70 factor, ECF subfamily
MIDEKEILRQCIRNNPRAQKLLYEKYASGLLGVCMRYSKNRAEAEDVLQEGFVKIFANIKNFEGRSSLIGWMRRIVINTSITMYHKNLKHQYHMDVDDFREKNIGDCELSDADFTQDELLAVIRDLPAGYRMVFNLYAIEGFKHKEIAAKMGIDINTSKSQYSRARKLIQCRLAELKAETGKTKDEE